MSNFEQATDPSGCDGQYSATIDGDFCVWSPTGGYLMTLALRAAGREASFGMPLSMSCHFLSAPKLEQVQLEVIVLRKTRVAESLRVSMRQDGRPVLDMMVWAGQALEGFEHEDLPMPEVPALDSLQARDYPAGGSGFQTMWKHFEHRPCGPLHWERDSPGQPRQRDWIRLRDVDGQQDAFLDAGRCALMLDTFTWPSAAQAHTGDGRFVAPTISFAVDYHRRAQSDWLLSDAHAPQAGQGRIAIHNQLWTPDGGLVATGTGTLLCRPRPQS